MLKRVISQIYFYYFYRFKLSLLYMVVGRNTVPNTNLILKFWEIEKYFEIKMNE